MAVTQSALGVRIATLASMAGLVLVASGCEAVSGIFGDAQDEPAVVEAPSVYAPCLESYGSSVSSVVSTADGSRDFYLSAEKPANVESDAWSSTSRAVYEYDVKAQRRRPIASTWDSEVVIEPYATLDPLRPTPVRPFRIAEKLEQIAVGGDGQRIVIGVSRKNLTGGLARLYSGAVPGADAMSTLHPGEGGGLAVVPINDDLNQEAIQSFSLSPDGHKVAAIVGDLSELRAYDLESGTLYVYNLGEKNAITVSNELPTPQLSIAVDRTPAITVNGAQLVWSPDSTTLAYVTPLGIGGWALQTLDYTAGTPTLVHSFENTTQPQVTWAGDGQSLFVVSTAATATEIFGDTTIQRLTAAKDGKPIGGVGLIKRQPNWRTVPSFVTLVGDNTLLFTWERHLFRFTIKEGDLGKATFVPVTERYPRDVRVLAQPVYGSAAADRAVYAINDPAYGNRVGVYTHITAEKCPVPTAEE